MRSNVTEALAELPPESKARTLLEDIRMALHAFQDLVEEEYPRHRYRYDTEPANAPATEEVLIALEEMRSLMQYHLQQLSLIYGLARTDNS